MVAPSLSVHRCPDDVVIFSGVRRHTVDFCHAMNEKLGLDLNLPPRDAGRSLSAAPMDNFLRKAGFPEEHIPGAPSRPPYLSPWLPHQALD